MGSHWWEDEDDLWSEPGPSVAAPFAATSTAGSTDWEGDFGEEVGAYDTAGKGGSIADISGQWYADEEEQPDIMSGVAAWEPSRVAPARGSTGIVGQYSYGAFDPNRVEQTGLVSPAAAPTFTTAETKQREAFEYFPDETFYDAEGALDVRAPTVREQATQMGGIGFDATDYVKGGTITAPTVSTVPAPVATPLPVKDPGPVLSALDDEQKSFIEEWRDFGFEDFNQGRGLTDKFVMDNWPQIQAIQAAYTSTAFGAWKTFTPMSSLIPLIGVPIEKFGIKGWQGEDKYKEGSAAVGQPQKRMVDFWRKLDPAEGFYGKTFNSLNVPIAGMKNVDATSWQGVMEWFDNRYPAIVRYGPNKGQPNPEYVPREAILADLIKNAQNWPRTTDQSLDLGGMVTPGVTPPPKGAAAGPQAAGNIDEALKTPLDLIRRQFTAGIIEAGALQSLLLNAFAQAQFGGQEWEDKPITWEILQAQIAASESGSWGGISSDIMANTELWAMSVIEQMIEGKKTGVKGGAFPATPGVKSFGGGVEWEETPKTSDEVRAIMNKMGPDDPNYGMMWELMTDLNAIEARDGGAGGAGDVDLQEKYFRALTDIHALKTAAGITAQQHQALTDWEKELQGRSLEVRGQEAERVKTQQELEQQRMTAETGGFIDGKETYESRLFEQRGEQEAEREFRETEAIQRAGAARQTAAEAEASRLAITEGGVESQAVQAQAAKDQVANTLKVAEATLMGKLAGVETLAHKELQYTQGLAEAELSGILWQQIGDLNQVPGYKGVETIALRTYALNLDIANRKMELEVELGKAASRRENTRVNYESIRVQNQTYIERGQLAEAVESRKEMNRIKEMELEDARNTMRLNTLMSLMNPVAMLMAQRMGMIPQLEAAMGIDLDIPEIAPMMPAGMSVPTAQMLNLFSPQDQQLIMAESSFRTGLSQEDISSVIHRQRPGAPGGQMLGYAGGR